MSHQKDDTSPRMPLQPEPEAESIVFRSATHPETNLPVMEVASQAGRPVLRLRDAKGRIWFEIGPYHGTEFLIDLPELRIYNPELGEVTATIGNVGEHKGGALTIFSRGERMAVNLAAGDDGGSVDVYAVPEDRIAELSARERGLAIFHRGSCGPVATLTAPEVK